MQGVKSDLMKHEKEKSLTSRGFKSKSSGIKQFDADCCLSVLGKNRSLDLQAPSRAVCSSWVAALHLVLVFHNLQARELPCAQ